MLTKDSFGSQGLVRAMKNTALVVSGSFVLAFGTGIFIIPFDLVTGGVSGIGIILQHTLSGFALFENISVTVYASVINWLLFIIGWIFLGRSFALKTLVSTLVYPIALSLATGLVGSGIWGGFFDLLSERYASFGSATLILATVFGGATIGAGCALTFLGGGSTGGADIVALTICRYVRGIKSSVMVFICDAVVILIGMLVINNLVLSLLGIVSALICAISIDKLFVGESEALIANVITQKAKELSDSVITGLNRTTTVLDAKGGYTGENKKLVVVSFAMSQYAEFAAIVAAVDETAFVTVHRAHRINGEGWTYSPPTPEGDGHKH